MIYTKQFKNLFVLSVLGMSGLGQAQELSEKSALASRGNAFNPDTSVNFLSLYQNSNKKSDDEKGFSLQEVELQFSADVDPYLRASVLLAVAQEDGEWAIDPEEVYAESLAIPYVTLKAGKFKTALGKHNQLHPHAYPFIDAPFLQTVILGDEGYGDVGVSGAVLIPHLSWFSELTLQALGANNENLFDSPTKDDISGVMRLRNLWDLSDATTLEFGLSGALGSNSWGGTSSLGGADLTIKFRPLKGGKYKSVLWSNEYLAAHRSGRASNASDFGDLKSLDALVSSLIYQFAERWHVGGRYDILGLTQKENLASLHKQSAILGYAPSEFSLLRLQYDHVKPEGAPREHKVALQLNVSLGAHPAHAY